MMLTDVRRLCGHDATGPSAVCDQSLARMSAPMCPPPARQSRGDGWTAASWVMPCSPPVDRPEAARRSSPSGIARRHLRWSRCSPARSLSNTRVFRRGVVCQATARPTARSANMVDASNQFYEDEHRLAEVVAAFLADGLTAGAPAAVIATAARRDALCHGLQTRGLDVAALIGAGTLTLLDARDTLDRFMRDGDP